MIVERTEELEVRLSGDCRVPALISKLFYERLSNSHGGGQRRHTLDRDKLCVDKIVMRGYTELFDGELSGRRRRVRYGATGGCACGDIDHHGDEALCWRYDKPCAD
uniref:Uncharacterized protein n=1 Tax=Florenciella parvula TaxID=236787 RepID=A0A7S2GCL7_9STRA